MSSNSPVFHLVQLLVTKELPEGEKKEQLGDGEGRWVSPVGRKETEREQTE